MDLIDNNEAENEINSSSQVHTKPSGNRSESRSLSPKFGSRLNHIKTFGYGFHDPKIHADHSNRSTHHIKEFQRTSSLNNQEEVQGQNTFRDPDNIFRTTNENFRETSDKFRTTFMKKSFYNKTSSQMNQAGPKGYNQVPEHEKERPGPRSNSLVGSLKPLDNMTKFPIERQPYATLEQKFVRENKLVAEKIKQSEKELMDKYSKMFNLNQNEIMSLHKNNEKRPDGNKRLSTPMKDLTSSRNFQKRRIINL